jgi:uncharacterized membrane protein
MRSLVSHPRVPHPADHESWQTRMADRVAGAFGTMGMFWTLVCWQLGWIVLATAGVWLFRADPYPFVFCLFLSNLIQLWALPVLGTATNRADEKRAVKADTDHAALTSIHHAVDDVAARLARIETRIGTTPERG